MSLKKYINLYNRIDKLIITQSTGTPAQFARKLGVTERQLYNYMRDIRELGQEVYYSEFSQSYCYSNSTEILAP